MIADAKRGDIDISARAYAQAFFGVTATPFGPVEGLGADALTVNPLLGRDSLAPFVEAAASAARACSRWCGPPTRAPPTSRSASWPTGGTVSEALARMVDELGAPGVGDAGPVRRRRRRRRHRARAAARRCAR